MRRASLDSQIVVTLVALLGVCCAAGLYLAIAAATQRIPLDPNEGWNAYHQAAAISGGALYPDAHSFMVNNYPPLSFYLIGALGLVVGDNIFAGRIVALVSFLIVTAAIAACARTMGTRRIAAVFGALFFASVLLLFSDYVGINDPQLMGHAVQIATLLIVLREPRTTSAVLLSATLLVVSLFVKHNLIVLPLAVLGWLAAYDRRSALRLTIAGLTVALFGLIAFRLAFGSELLGHLASARVYSLANVEAGVRAALRWTVVPFAGTAMLLRYVRDDKHAVFCAIYANLAFFVGVCSLGGAGVDVNALFDAAIAFSLAVALLLDRVAKEGIPAAGLIAALYLLPLTFSLSGIANTAWLTRDFWLHPASDDAETARADVEYLRGRTGPAVCETLPLCYWAAKDPEVDVFNLGQAYATGTRSDRDLVAQLNRRRFASLEFESLSSFQLGNSVLEAVNHNYRIARSSDNGVFLTPQGSR
jgi:hypothetical protein